MEDFVFGTLATDGQRLAYQRSRRGGVTHDYLRSPYAPKPGQPVQIELTLGPGQAYDRAWVYWATDGLDPAGHAGLAAHGQAAAMQKAEVAWDMLEWGYVQRFRTTLPAQPEGALVRYYVSAGAADGSEVQADGGKIYAYYVTHLGLPEWARQAVIYQIMVDRFFPGAGKAWKTPSNPSGFYGGALRGMVEKLDYLAELGVNVLWLTPIFPSPSHHGYDATDLFSIEPRLGTKEDLRLLLDEAHSRQMRLLLDLVPNHLSSLHWSFQEAVTDQNSPRTEWYTFKRWPDEYESFFGVKSHPQLNLRNPEARQHVLDAAAFWLEFGVDGYRVDYAVGPTPDFWADLRRVCLSIKPDCWTFGEIVEPSVSQRNFYGLLNGALDFMLLEALRKTIAFRAWDGAQFLSFLERHEAYFPADFSRPSFLDNHDMNRFLWAARGDRTTLKLAALCQFTLSGPPVIYYGTEVGLSQESDVRQAGRGLPEESRLPMLWGTDQDGELLDFYRSLTALRREQPGLWSGPVQALAAGADLLAYQRPGPAGDIAVAINLADRPQKVVLPGSWSQILLSTQAACRLVAMSAAAELALPARSGVVLK